LILPTGANIQTAAGDIAEFVRISGGNWQCLNYRRSDGKSLVDIGAASNTEVLNESPVAKYISPEKLSFSKRAAKFWVNFNGTGTPTIRDSLNVSSITDNGVGSYTVNLSITMNNANYAIGSYASGGATLTVAGGGSTDPTPTSFRSGTFIYNNGTPNDVSTVTYIGFGS
jgi:hypothetical protein